MIKPAIITKSEKETQKIAADLAHEVIGSLQRWADQANKSSVVIALEGELGVGKTTFVKGFAKALGMKVKIKSPTFTLMKEYKIPSLKKSQIPRSLLATGIPAEGLGTNSKHLVHIDCYRVRDHKDLAILDLKSLFKSPDNIVLIEWPERVRKILPKKFTRVHIDHISQNERRIYINLTT
jgi:tRNA threonylcarbamoyladenosine biosynthesis protein TsaE